MLVIDNNKIYSQSSLFKHYTVTQSMVTVEEIEEEYRKFTYEIINITPIVNNTYLYFELDKYGGSFSTRLPQATGSKVRYSDNDLSIQATVEHEEIGAENWNINYTFTYNNNKITVVIICDNENYYDQVYENDKMSVTVYTYPSVLFTQPLYISELYNTKNDNLTINNVQGTINIKNLVGLSSNNKAVLSIANNTTSEKIDNATINIGTIGNTNVNSVALNIEEIYNGINTINNINGGINTILEINAGENTISEINDGDNNITTIAGGTNLISSITGGTNLISSITGGTNTISKLIGTLTLSSYKDNYSSSDGSTTLLIPAIGSSSNLINILDATLYNDTSEHYSEIDDIEYNDLKDHIIVTYFHHYSKGNTSYYYNILWNDDSTSGDNVFNINPLYYEGTTCSGDSNFIFRLAKNTDGKPLIYWKKIQGSHYFDHVYMYLTPIKTA